jgi:para-nitrobenzyl esterase
MCLGFAHFLESNSVADSELPQNVGLLDVVSALEWVQRNIGVFGGDKTSVTISGEQSSGTMVSMLDRMSDTKGAYFCS